MPNQLQDEIKQGKPFVSAEQEAMLNVIRTAAVLDHELADMLKKTYEITPTQYNVLRILRGAGEKGLCRNEVRDRLIAQVPDATRLLDRMVDVGLITRVRDTNDRRYVTAHITPKGLAVLAELDGPLTEIHRRQLGHMSETELRTLIKLLVKARERT
jgi:DNA-binding MarR family transcriptional regulator